MESVSRSRTRKYQESVWQAAKALDSYLLVNHIGEFEAVRFYHFLYPSLKKEVPKSQRAIYFKKAIGQFGVIPRGKVYSNGLVNYYESL